MRGIRTSWDRPIGALVALALGLAVAPATRADEKVYEQALPSLAWVISPEEGTSKVSTGTGVLIEERRGLLMTAYHVVEERAGVLAFFPAYDKDGELVTETKFYLEHAEELGIPGHVVAADAKRDLALVRLARVPAGAKATAIAARSPKPGQAVFAIGNSGAGEGVLWRYRDGKVRQVYRKAFGYGTGQKVEARIIEMTVPTNSGDSGGPIVNGDGELVAITAAVDGKVNAVDYGIDVAEIREVLAANLPAADPLDLLAQAPPALDPPVVPDPTPPNPRLGDAWDLILGKPRDPQPEPTPVARLEEVRAMHNIYRDGRRGMEVHVKVQVDHAEGRPCDVLVIVCDEAHKALRARDPEFAAVGQSLGASTRITPRFDGSLFDDVAVFLPYAAINDAAAPDQMQFTYAVDVREAPDGRWLVEDPKWGEMRRSPKASQPEAIAMPR